MLPFVRSDLVQLTAYTPHPEATIADTVPDFVDSLDTNECPYDLPPELKQKLVANYENHIPANRYPDGGHGVLKQLIATYVNETLPEPGEVGADGISIGNGSDELIRSVLIATCLGNQGSILVANPTFSMYDILAQTLSIPVVKVERDEQFAMVLSQAQVALDSPKGPPIRVVFVTHPNSPTGNALTDAEIEWLKGLPEHILVVVDEAYFEFSQQTLAAEVLRRSNWVVLRTFSKAMRLAAHRVGYAIANPTFIQTLEKIRLPYNMPAISLAAAQLVMEHRQHLLANLPEVMAERHRVEDAISALPQITLWPSQANFIYVRADTVEATNLLAQTLKEKGTYIRHTGGGLRITIGSPTENSRTINHLQSALKGCLTSHSKTLKP